MEASTICRAQRSDIGAVAHALAQAFEDDPVVTFAWPDDGKRVRRAERSFDGQTRALWDRREIYADETFSSIAVWARPDEWKIPTSAVLRITATAVRTRVRLAALIGYLRTEALHPEEPHWYLEFLGTVPSKQGTGLGGQVMTPVLERADEQGVAVWTWSSNRRNLAFYHRQGFEVLDEIPFAAGGPPIFPIRRPPRG